MFKTPTKPGTTPSKAHTTSKKKGLLEDGQWLCDCTPRQPAVCRTVKKETKNKGKRFYSCQERKCEMFLWEDQAKARERDALLLHNCRSENGVTGTIRPKTPEPAPPLDLNPNPNRSRTWAGPKLMDAKITDYTARQPRPQQRVFKGLDNPREGYQVSDLSDSDEEEEAAPDKAPSQQLSQAQNRQRSYLSQLGPPGEISQTLRDSSSYRPPSSGVAVAVADAGVGPAFRSQALQRPPSGLVDPVTPTAKRKRSVFRDEVEEDDDDDDDDDDEFGGDDLAGSETERQLAQITDESARKQQRTRDVYETPSARRVADADEGIRNDLGLPTPTSRRPGLLVASEEEERGRSAKRQRRVGFTSPVGDGEARFQPGAVGDPTTPTPYRKTDALAAAVPTTPSTPAAAANDDDTKSPAAAVDDYPKIAEEVLSLLSGQPVSESTKRTLKAAMERHEMRVKGVARGREAARAGIAERDERIAELQARVVSLENGRAMDRARLKELGVLGERLVRLSEEE